MTTRADLHALVDELPENEIERVRQTLERALSPAERALVLAPEDDEPETEGERRAVQEARESRARGERGVLLEELRRELGL